MYEKQGFHSGGKLKAAQLVAMEDGIINAEKLATELKNDASHIYDKQEAFEAITWDGVIGDREVVTMPNISEACMVKLSDVILTREDYIGSRVTAFTPNGKESLIITEDLLYSKEEEEEQGIRGTNAIVTVIDVNKANLNGANFQTTGTYGICTIDGSGSSYVKSLSKTTIEIKEDVLPELPAEVNMEKGTGEGSTQQTPRMEKMTVLDENGHFYLKFPVGDNPGSHGLSATQEYGACAPYSISLCGRSSAQGKHALAINNSTIAKGDESFSSGYATVAEGPSSFSGGSGTYAKGTAAVSLGHHTQALADYSTTFGNNTIVEAPTEEDKANGILKGQLGIATGTDTRVRGYAASAHGSHTIADQIAQTVVGQYNDYNFTKDGFHSLFQVGCGSNEESRVNGINIGEGGEIIIRWEGAYYSLNLMLNLISNAHGGPSFFDAAKKQ